MSSKKGGRDNNNLKDFTKFAHPVQGTGCNGVAQNDSFIKNYSKYKHLVSFFRWFPDLWYDSITPEMGGIRLDLDQRVFMRSLSRFASLYAVFPRGYSKCVASDTMLYTDEGIKEIGSYFDYKSDDEESYIQSDIKLVNRYGELESTNAGVYSGYKDTKKIFTEEGYEVENTLNHPMLVMDKDGKIKWKQSKDVEVGDYVPINRHNDIWGNGAEFDIDSAFDEGVMLSKASNKVIPSGIMSAPKDIVVSFIRGLFYDCLDIRGNIFLYTDSEKISKQIQILLLNFGIISKRNIQYYSLFKCDAWCISIEDENIDIYMKEIGFRCEDKQDGLLRGFDKDIIPYQDDVVNRFCKDIGVMCDNDNQLTYQKLRYLLSLDGAELCDGYKELKELNDLGYFFSKVKDVENSKSHVYDLSLPKTNSFVSNGFISHNTLIEIMVLYHTAIFYPDIELSMTAQTRENASKLVEEKHRELMRFYPLLQDEVVREVFTKDTVDVRFTSGGIIN